MAENIKILIVDDEKKICQLIKDSLETISDNYFIKTAYSGMEAISLINTEPFDILVTDLRMPQMDGNELIKQTIEKAPDTQIIVITGHGDMDSAINAMRLGAVNYIRKPISIEVLDIAIQKAYEKTQLSIKLKNSEKQYRELVDNAKTAIIKIDTKGCILFFNEYAEKLLGYSLNEVLESNISLIYQGDIISHMNEKNEIDHESLNKTKSGKKIWILWNNKKLFDDNMNHIGWISIGYNITKRKKMEKELYVSKQIAESANKAKSHFLANMSHDLRTPIYAIVGFAELLIDTGLNKEQQKYLNTLISESDFLINLVNDVLDFSKIEQGKLEIENIDFNLLDMLDNIIQVNTFSANKKKIVFKSSIDPDIPKFIKGDPGRLRQIISNLLSNSIKFTQKGEVCLHVELMEKHENRYKIKFMIKDTGIGISNEMHEKIFDSFVQEDSTTTRKYGGTGLGVAICKQLVELMNGKIGLDSELNKGSNFWFFIDFEKSKTIEIVSNDDFINNNTNKTIVNETKIQDNISCLKENSNVTREQQENLHKILLVDDSETNQYLGKHFLEKAGFQVDIANNGLQAVECFQKKKYNLILMDIQMPVMSGFEAANLIREKETSDTSSLQIPIIAMSARVDKDCIDQCKKNGMNDFISKPVKKKALLDKISNYLLLFNKKETS
ncbi:multi-sensor hybrid histidine kinase [Candidatus Magnetomorum sp. HK-1]|nr:multi-sensor hybrid histidine kinase [Candidatus Magnetomorum sp. HK-1]